MQIIALKTNDCVKFALQFILPEYQLKDDKYNIFDHGKKAIVNLPS